MDGQLVLLRPGDVVTYCFTTCRRASSTGDVRAAAWEARARGILFDMGHGMASFGFAVAEPALADGFLPDTISTDRYRRHLAPRPRHDLPRTISKLIAAGCPNATPSSPPRRRRPPSWAWPRRSGPRARRLRRPRAPFLEPRAAPLLDAEGASDPAAAGSRPSSFARGWSWPTRRPRGLDRTRAARPTILLAEMPGMAGG